MNQDRADAPKPESAEGHRRQSAHGGLHGGRGPKREHNRRWLFLLVDVLLLAAIVAAVIFVVSLLTPASVFDETEVEERSITYQIELEGVEIQHFNVQQGDAVIDSATGNVIGHVMNFEGRDYEVYTDRVTEVVTSAADGEKITYMVDKITYPTDKYKTYTVTVAVDADYIAGIGYSVGDCRIAVGRAYQVRFPGYTDSAVCVAIHAE